MVDHFPPKDDAGDLSQMSARPASWVGSWWYCTEAHASAQRKAPSCQLGLVAIDRCSQAKGGRTADLQISSSFPVISGVSREKRISRTTMKRRNSIAPCGP